eukprot:TRINITY_DN7442_c0_g1_i1.p1 TRINITY_DN7442_c0_g1~~TRINITY_DN7442_c0_g1_i1.p1  ORF type:complete len:349 (+),score=74.86 TRINITY_DN7442_c0_g1_i1:58-1104(+)
MSWNALKALVKPATKASGVIHRKDIEEERKKAYLEEQEKKKQARDEKRKQWIISDELGDNTETEEGKTGYVPKEEVIKRLRQRGEPITLFGESEVERRKRLQKIVAEEYQRGDIGNQTTKKDLISRTYDATLAAQKHMLESGITQAEAEQAVQQDIDAQISKKEAEMKKATDSLKAMDDLRKPTASDMDPDKSSEYVTLFITAILAEWEASLLSRPAAVKKTLRGRNEATRYEETGMYLKPLLKGLSSNQIPETQIASFQKMAFHALQGEYVKSHDLYLKMSIGTAAWPLGVTQVGIHSRVGRERISSNKQAHILNNDVHRKFIQGFKRLITQRQVLHPSDPSKMVTI